jgi:hypothetical protein
MKVIILMAQGKNIVMLSYLSYATDMVKGGIMRSATNEAFNYHVEITLTAQLPHKIDLLKSCCLAEPLKLLQYFKCMKKNPEQDSLE